MLLQKYFKSNDYRTVLGIGQCCLVVSVLGLLISASRILNTLISNQTWLHFLQGFFLGLSMTILVLSAIFSIKGLILLRQDRAGGKNHG